MGCGERNRKDTCAHPLQGINNKDCFLGAQRKKKAPMIERPPTAIGKVRQQSNFYLTNYRLDYVALEVKLATRAVEFITLEVESFTTLTEHLL